MPSIQQDVKQVRQARTLQTGMPIRNQGQLNKQQEPQPQSRHAWSPKKHKFLLYHPPKPQPPEVQAQIPQPWVIALLSQHPPYGGRDKRVASKQTRQAPQAGSRSSPVPLPNANNLNNIGS